MRTYDNGVGNGFTVTFNEGDTGPFASRWPGSTVEGRGSYSFADNGDVVDASGSHVFDCGGDWVCFMGECQRWGEKHIGALRRRHHALQKRVEALYSVQLHKLPKV